MIKQQRSKRGSRKRNKRLLFASLESRLLLDGDVLSVAKHKYEISYSPTDLGAVGPPPPQDTPENILGQSLLERAGLQRGRDQSKRYDVLNNEAGQLRNNPDKPI